MKKPKEVLDEDGYYAQKQICDELGCTYEALKMAQRGGMPIGENGLIQLKTAREWFRGRHINQTKIAELRRLKLQAEIDDKRAASRLKGLEEAKQRGEMHDIKECEGSLGLLLSTTWQEIMALPSRLQAAFPENPNVESVAVTLVNDTADRLQAFLKEHGPK